MELFISICDGREISPETSRKWLDKITQQYLSENRHFHNVALIEKKFNLIKEIAGHEKFMDALVLATLFQYFHYDVKSDLKKENCDEFRLFVNETGIKDVSLVGFVIA